MFTRKQYMNKECTHEEYYNQFVTKDLIKTVVNQIGEKELIRSTDPNLNNILLRRWDDLQGCYLFSNSVLGNKFREVGDSWSLCGVVCVGKQAAKLWLTYLNNPVITKLFS